MLKGMDRCEKEINVESYLLEKKMLAVNHTV